MWYKKLLQKKWFHPIVLFHFCRYYVSLLTFFKIFTLWCVFVLTWSTFSFLLIFCCTKISAHRRELFFTENEVVALVKKWVLQGVPYHRAYFLTSFLVKSIILNRNLNYDKLYFVLKIVLVIKKNLILQWTSELLFNLLLKGSTV